MAETISNWHSDIKFRVATWFRAHGRVAFSDTGVILDGGVAVSADVGVLWDRPESSRTAYHPACEYAAVVEIVPPGGRLRWYERKLGLYAGSRILVSWLVLPHPDSDWDAMVAVYRVGAGGYTVVEQTTMGALERRPGYRWN